jgi:uncharacterized membrane protein YfcA
VHGAACFVLRASCGVRRAVTMILSALVLTVIAFGVSILTFFAGFGLGTLLMPAFALFLPVEVAVAATAIVHGANNVFKVALLARQARRHVVLAFGLPAIAAAIVGAYLLSQLAGDHALGVWYPFGLTATITPVKLVLGALIVVFGLFELLPPLRALRAPAGWLPLGGILAGFFGGLSGHQGALRAAFLSRVGMSPGEFVATQSVLGLMVDASRLLVYAVTFLAGSRAAGQAAIPWPLVIVATIGALAGAWVGRSLLPKVTLPRLQLLVGALLIAVGIALAGGLI